MSLLKFQEWEHLNEENIFSKIQNWLSRNFGGALEKLDGLLSAYKKLEMRFVDEWEEIKVDNDKLEIQRGQVKNDPAELKKIDRMLERNQSVIAAASKVHEKNTDEIFMKAKKLIESSKNLQTYWETNKVKIDAEIAENMYKIAKKLTDSKEADELYSNYKKTALAARRKDEEFKEMYGNLIGDRVPPPPKHATVTPSSKGLSVKSVGGMESSFELLSTVSLLEFADAVKDFPSDQAKKLVSYLTSKRNDLYVAMDMERDVLNTEIEKMPRDHETRDYASTKIKEIRERYMNQIRDLRSKITVAKKYA